MNKANLQYIDPTVMLLNDTGLGIAEFAARTAYDSYDKSEHLEIRDFAKIIKKNKRYDCDYPYALKSMKTISSSELLDQLTWVSFHHSVLEHIIFQFYIKDIGRGVLQELVRHRIASYTVKSTRYTMLPVLYAYAAAFAQDGYKQSMKWFMNKITELDPLIITDEVIKQETYANWWYKLRRHEEVMGGHRKLCELFMSKDAITKFIMCQTQDECYEALMQSKSKRNAGDAFKYLVDDNWKTELVMTINLRNLKNFLDLRMSGAAWFQIRTLSYKIYDELPLKYRSLISKKIYNAKKEQEED